MMLRAGASAKLVEQMGEVILLSLTASLNPTLLAATTVMLLLDNPAKLMGGYLLGAYLTNITLGLVIVLSSPSSSNTSKKTLSPAADLALGALFLVLAWVIHAGHIARLNERRRARKAAKPDKGRRGGSGSSARGPPGPRS